MPAGPKKISELHRVTCRCQAFDCHLGQYTDAYGVQQTGVEVMPDTFKSHALADRRNKALLSVARQKPSISIDQNGPSEDNLLQHLHNLDLNQATPRISSSCTDVHDVGLQESQPSPGRDDVRQVTQDAHNTTTRSSGNKSCGTSSRTCLAAISARNNGVKTYDCGRYFIDCNDCKRVNQ